MHQVGNLADGLVGVFHQEDAAAHDGLEDYLLHRVATDALDERREVLRRQTEFVGIVCHAALLVKVLAHQFDEGDKGLRLAPLSLLRVAEVAAEERAEPVSERHEQQFLLVVGKDRGLGGRGGAEQGHVVGDVALAACMPYAAGDGGEHFYQSQGHHRSPQHVPDRFHAVAEHGHGHVGRCLVGLHQRIAVYGGCLSGVNLVLVVVYRQLEPSLVAGDEGDMVCTCGRVESLGQPADDAPRPTHILLRDQRHVQFGYPFRFCFHCSNLCHESEC